MLEPKLVLMDEPSAGLSPKMVGRDLRTDPEDQRGGPAILIVEQNAEAVARDGPRGYVLAGGENRFEGTGQELLLNDPGVGRLLSRRLRRIGREEAAWRRRCRRALAGADAGPRRGVMAALRGRTGLGLALLLTLVIFWLLGQRQGASLSEMLSLTVWGVMLGGIIALGAIGLTLVYGVLGFPNFAHGELVTLSLRAQTFAALLPAGPAMRPFSFGWELMAGLILSMPIVSLIALAVDRVFRPLRVPFASLVLFAMASLAAAFFLRSAIYLVWGSDFLFYYRVAPIRRSKCRSVSGCRPIESSYSCCDVLVIITWLLLEQTGMGKAMRATDNNRSGAGVVGINTKQVVPTTLILMPRCGLQRGLRLLLHLLDRRPGGSRRTCCRPGTSRGGHPAAWPAGGRRGAP